LQHRLGRAGLLTEREACAGGEAAEGVGETGREGGDVVEGEDPVVAGEGEEVADGGRDGGERHRGGIDQVTEDAGGEGFAGAGRALEDEEGIRSGGAEGGQEPRQAAEPVRARRKVEAGAEGLEIGGRVIGRDGRGNPVGGAGGFQESVSAGGDGPAIGRDIDELAFGVGEIEEDLLGDVAGDAGADAAGDGEALVEFVAGGLRFEVIEDGVEGLGGGQGVVESEELLEEPIAVGAGADGEEEETAGRDDGEAHEGLAIGGGKGDALPGDGEEGLDRSVVGLGWLSHKVTIQSHG